MISITFAAALSDGWEPILVCALAASAVLVFGYRVYRLSKGGPMADVYGGAVLAILLIGTGLLVAADVGWARWAALAYGFFFGLVVMPTWVLAVLLPLRPGPVDYAFTGLYWLTLIAVIVSAVAA